MHGEKEAAKGRCKGTTATATVMVPSTRRRKGQAAEV